MSTTEQEVVVEEQSSDVEDAAFAAGFAEAQGDEPPASTEQVEQAEPESSGDAENPPAAEQQAPAVFAGLTEEQIKDLLIKAGEVDSMKAQIEKNFGKYGELNRTIQQLMARTEAGAPVEVTEEDVADLAEEFPELANLQLKVLQKVVGKLKGGPAQAPSVDVEGLRNQIKAEVQAEADRKLEERLLKARHRDWQDLVQSQDFTLWGQNSLKPEEFQALVQSNDAEFISDHLDKFKSWRDTAAKQAKQKQRRLENAVSPKGDAAPVPSIQTEEEAFLTAFKTARG